MRYLRVTWHHELPDEPVELYSEIDESGWEVRKVEVHRNGRRDYAGPEQATGTTMLSETRFPSIEEIAAQEEFTPHAITGDEFERVWQQATSR